VRWVLGLLIAAGALIALGLALLFYQPAGLFPSAAEYTPTQLQAAEAHVATLQSQLRAIKQAVRQNQAQPFVLRVREVELNTYVAAHPETLHSLPGVHSLRVDLAPGAITIYAQVTYQRRTALITVTGRPELTADGRYVRFIPTGVRIGALPVPGGVRERLLARIQQEAGQNLWELPAGVRVARLGLLEGELVVEGYTERRVRP